MRFLGFHGKWQHTSTSLKKVMLLLWRTYSFPLSSMLDFSASVCNLPEAGQGHRLPALIPLVEGAALQVIRHGANICEAPAVHRGKQRAEPPDLQEQRGRAEPAVTHGWAAFNPHNKLYHPGNPDQGLLLKHVRVLFLFYQALIVEQMLSCCTFQPKRRVSVNHHRSDLPQGCSLLSRQSLWPFRLDDITGTLFVLWLLQLRQSKNTHVCIRKVSVLHLLKLKGFQSVAHLSVGRVKKYYAQKGQLV